MFYEKKKIFFNFLDVSGENTHFGEKNREKNNFTILTSDKIDVRKKLTFDILNRWRNRLLHNVEMWLDHSRNGLKPFFGV